MKIATARGRISSRIGASLHAMFVAERDRWILWLPVALGTGIGLYFALPYEPPVFPGLGVLAALVLLAGLFRNVWPLRLVLLALIALALGFVVAQWGTHDVAATVLERTMSVVTIEGRVEAVEPSERGPRVILEVLSISRLEPAQTPPRIRMRLHADDAGLRPGDTIRVRARLAPPPSASYPGGYDFSR